MLDPMATARPLVRAPELQGVGWVNVPDPLSLAALRGRVVILHFWTLSCVNCLHVVEELRELEIAFPEELTVVGVHSPKFPHEADHEAVRRAVARHRVNHPVIDDPEMRTWAQYAVRAWPTLVVVDPAGYVVGAVAGEGHVDALSEAVERLVAEAEEKGTLRRGDLDLWGPPPGEQALRFPGKVASDGGERVVIADTGRDRVLVCDLDGRVLGEHRLLEQPQGVRFDGDHVLVCESTGDQVWRVGPDDSRTLVADGIASPWDLAHDGDRLVICEAGRHRLWVVDAFGARAVAGTAAEGLRDGPAADALLAQPSGITALPGPAGVAFLDAEASALRVLRDEQVETLLGQGLFDWGTADGDRVYARLQHPLGVAAAPDGTLYVADTFNGLLRVWRDGRLETMPVAGLLEPGGLDVLPDGRLVVADTGNHRIVIVDPASARSTELVIHGASGEASLGAGPGELAVGAGPGEL
jgi:thiol-disulfide isomerase/thioredoxin/sugar lactone lactonase YvrE